MPRIPIEYTKLDEFSSLKVHRTCRWLCLLHRNSVFHLHLMLSWVEETNHGHAWCKLLLDINHSIMYFFHQSFFVLAVGIRSEYYVQFSFSLKVNKTRRFWRTNNNQFMHGCSAKKGPSWHAMMLSGMKGTRKQFGTEYQLARIWWKAGHLIKLTYCQE